MRDGPEVQSHLVGHQCVSVVKQVDVTPSQWAVLLKRTDKTGRLKDVPAFMEEAHGGKKSQTWMVHTSLTHKVQRFYAKPT